MLKDRDLGPRPRGYHRNQLKLDKPKVRGVSIQPPITDHEWTAVDT